MTTETDMRLSALRADNDRMLRELQHIHAAVRQLPVHTGADGQRYVLELDMLRAIQDRKETQ